MAMAIRSGGQGPGRRGEASSARDARGRLIGGRADRAVTVTEQQIKDAERRAAYREKLRRLITQSKMLDARGDHRGAAVLAGKATQVRETLVAMDAGYRR